MKLLLAGNLANYGYFFTKLLRQHNIDADLLMEKYPPQANDPKSLDSDLTEYPSWIKFWDNHSVLWKLQIIRIMRKYDIIQASTELPIFCLFTGKPYLVFPTGSDITGLVFEKTVKGKLLQRAYKKAKIIIYPGAYMHPLIKKLNTDNAIFIPPPWDFKKFQPIQQDKKNEKFIIFQPTFQDWSKKGNDELLRAFIRLCHEQVNVFLILINRGRDIERTIELLKEPSCQGKYNILPKSVSQDELLKLYNQADVVVDAFTHGSTGLIGQEAMACEKPLIQYVNEDLYRTLYRDVPPILNAKNENEIYDKLKYLVENRHMIDEIGKKSREWLLRHHDPDKIAKKYIFIYNAISQKLDFQTIRDELISMDRN